MATADRQASIGDRHLARSTSSSFAIVVSHRRSRIALTGAVRLL